ncbi:hypothetical protein EOI86_15715 [Hwanghaeella grinnelliae]|uniref:Uncharacterized protein n=1 Tax=Hwanghaeella grinnelliae TaxID=2500179 RepID=A0A437QQC1_9PROT|nr:hypothetical protein [Hwanghaeella grinnelliae]RVU36627.1 hypothetical protein EOI86_15715 [Hwanghaeella grinnelliae]
MSEEELANVEPTAVMLIAAAVFIITILAAMVLQVLAFRHKREHGSAYMLKDSLFKHKELVYTEQGMWYINWQKRLAMICTVIIAALLLLDRFVI